MNRSLRHRLGGLVLVAGLAGMPLPAHAASNTTISSPACGTIRADAPADAPATTHVDADNAALRADVVPGGTVSFGNVPGGTYFVRSALNQDGAVQYVAMVTVTPCSSTSPRRPADGDQTGDGKADLLGIQAGTGDLYLYPSTSTGLASGTKVGTGWNGMVFMQQVKEVDGAGSRNVLVAVRSDGTVWQYDNPSSGRLTNGRQIGSGLAGHKNFAVVPQNNPIEFGHYLLASRTDTVVQASALGHDTLGTPHTMAMNPAWTMVTTALAPRAFDNDPANEALAIDQSGTMTVWENSNDTLSKDTSTLSYTVVGHGWDAMGIVTAPGSINGDPLTDLVARRSDGNLYRYLNTGGRLGTAVLIGHNWNGIRLLA